MNVLITGAGGQLGLDCAAVFGPSTVVHALDSGDLDITDQDKVRDQFRRAAPQVVVNCAAYTAVDRCESEREKCWRVNGDGAGIVASACAEIGARLIHISTDYVFDGTKNIPEPYLETDPVNPLSAYGASKLAGEKQVREHLRDHIILRTSWLYGIGGPNFLKTMLRLAVADPHRTIRVVHDQYGSFTWTHRLALQIRTLLDAGVSGTFHATAEGWTTWYEGARVFLEAMRIPYSLAPCSTDEYPTAARRPPNSILENSRLKQCGLNQMVSWEKDVTEFAGRFRDRLLAEVAG